MKMYIVYDMYIVMLIYIIYYTYMHSYSFMFFFFFAVCMPMISNRNCYGFIFVASSMPQF